MSRLLNRILVVGAGPAGLSLAWQLARGGQEVCLLEARRDFNRGLRGDALMPCGLEALARMGLWELLEGLPQRTLADWTVWLEGRQLFRVAEPMGALQPCRLVPQTELLAALLERAQALPTFHWRPGASVCGLLQADGRVRGVQLSSGEDIEGDLVVGCDGRDSAVRRASGWPLRPQGAPLDLAWLTLPLEPANPAVDPAAVGDPPPRGFLTLVGGGAIASACRGARGDLTIGWLLRPGEALPNRSPQAWAEAVAQIAPPELAALLRQRGAALSRPQRFSVQVGMAHRWSGPGLLLLGDAAHPMSPIRAQGINLALRDSLVAAQQLLAAEPDQLEAACGRIEQLRRPEVRRLQGLQRSELRQGHWIGHNPILRHALARTAPLLGPLARRVWQARQRPLRQGAVWL